MTEKFIKVASVADFANNSVKVIEANGKRIALCHAEGEFFAIADLCTHDNGPLGEGELSDHQVECPRHGARFDIRSGKALCLPAILPVPTYKVEVRQDEVFIEV